MSRRSSRALLCVAAVLAAGCGAEQGEENGEPPAVSYPDCPSTLNLVLVGELDGQQVDESVPITGFSFINKVGSSPGYLELTDPSGTLVHVEFDQTLVGGSRVAATGWVDLSSGGGPHVGQCETDPLAGSLGQDPQGGNDLYTFLLTDLHEAPFCAGAAVTGELRGCALN